MIDDALQELATLYALDTLRGDELRDFEEQLAGSSELQKLVRSLRDSADGLAFALPPVAPPAAMRERVVGSVQPERKAQNVVPFPSAARTRPGVNAAVAALVAVTSAGLAVFYGLKAKAERKERMLAEIQAASAIRQREALAADKSSLTTEKDELLKARATAEAMLTRVKTELEEAGTTLKKMEADLTASKTENTTLAQQVADLRKRSLSDQAHIALLTATPKGQKAAAVSVWDQARQEGVVVVENLPALKADKNYQLWVIDGEKPVSAGVLKLDGKGGGRIQFKPRAAIESPSKFAVTIEPLGEQPAPTLKDLVLAGD